jgi:hypothetical protein
VGKAFLSSLPGSPGLPAFRFLASDVIWRTDFVKRFYRRIAPFGDRFAANGAGDGFVFRKNIGGPVRTV